MMRSIFFVGLMGWGVFLGAAVPPPAVAGKFSAKNVQVKPIELKATLVDGHYMFIGVGMLDKISHKTGLVGISGIGSAFSLEENTKPLALSLKGLPSGNLRSFAARDKTSAQWAVDRLGNTVYSRHGNEDWKLFTSSVSITNVYVGYDDVIWGIGAVPFYLYYRKESTKDEWKPVSTAEGVGATLVSLVRAFSASLLDVTAYAVSAGGFLLKVNQQKNGFEKIREALPDGSPFQDIAVAHSEMVVALSSNWNVYRKYTGKKGDKQTDWASLVFMVSSDGGKTTKPLTDIQQITLMPDGTLFLRGGTVVLGTGDIIEWPIYRAQLPEILVSSEDAVAQQVPALTLLSEHCLAVSLAGDSSWEGDHLGLTGPNALGELCRTVGKVGAAWTKTRTPALEWFSFIRKDGPECGIGLDGKVYRHNVSLKKEWEADTTAPANAVYASMGYAGDAYVIANRKVYLKKFFATADEAGKKWEQLGDLNCISVGVAQVDNDGTVLSVGLDGKLYCLNSLGKGWDVMLEFLPGHIAFKHIIVVDKNTFFAVGVNNHFYRNYSGTPGNQEKYWTEVVCSAALGQRITGIQHAAVTPGGAIAVIGEPKHTISSGADWAVYYGKIDLKYGSPTTVVVSPVEQTQKNKRDSDAVSRMRTMQAFNEKIPFKKTTLAHGPTKKIGRFSRKQKPLVS